MEHVKQKPSDSEKSYSRAHQSSNASIENTSIVRGSEVQVDKKEDRLQLLNAQEPTKEGIKNVIEFLKDKIPGLKMKMDVRVPGEEIVGSDDATEELVGEGIEETNSADEGEDDSIEEIASMDSGKHFNTKLFFGGVLHNTEDSSIGDELVRVSADITDTERDSFILHVPGRSKKDIDTRKNTVSKEQVAALAAQGISDLMPPEVAEAFWGLEKAPLKVKSLNLHRSL